MVGVPEVGAVRGALRVLRDGLLEVRDGARRVVLGEERGAQIVEGARVAGGDLHGALVGAHGVLRPAGGEEGGAEVGLPFGVAGRELGGAGELARGVGEPAAGEVRDAQRGVALRVGGGELDGALQLDEGVVGAAQDEERAAELEVRGGVGVVELDRRAQVPHGGEERGVARRGVEVGRDVGPGQAGADVADDGRRVVAGEAGGGPVRLLGGGLVAPGERRVSLAEGLVGGRAVAARHRRRGAGRRRRAGGRVEGHTRPGRRRR